MRVLFLTHRLPYAPNRGDRVRAFHMLRHLHGHADVDVFSLVHDADEARRAGDLASIAASVTIAPVHRLANLARAVAALPTKTPLTHVLLNSPAIPSELTRLTAARRPDVVFAYCSGLAHLALRPELRTVPCVLDMVDVDSAKWRSLATTTSGPRAWIYRREANVLAGFESEITRHARAAIVTTENERRTLRDLVPDANVAVLQNGVDVERLQPPAPPAGSATVIFCGVMNYPPNEEAAVYLVDRIWPIVRAQRPDARLQLVGSSPTAKVRRLASPASGIEVTGTVPDVRSYLWQAAVSAAPLLTARGVQNKVLEAVAAGLPAVVTPVVAGGLPAELLPAVVEAGTAEAFAQALLGFLAMTPAERRNYAARADCSALTWGTRLRPLVPMLQAAADGI